MRLDSIGTLFSNSWHRLKEHFAVAAQIYLLPMVLIVISQLLFLQKTLPALVLGGIIEILGIILSVLASIALISLFGKGTDFAASFRAGFKFFWAVIWIAILAALAVIGGYVMFIIPGIMLAVQLSLVTYALVLESKHGMAALATSREYLKGYWWAFFGRGLLLSLFFGAAMLVLFLPATLILGAVGGELVYVIVFFFFVLFAASYQYEIYSNLRRLKPDVAEAAAKAERGFLKVAIVVGIVGAVALVVLFCVAAFFVPRLNGPNPYPSGDYGYPPGTPFGGGGTAAGGGAGEDQVQISPVSGPVGTWVTISDPDAATDFDATNTILMKGLVAAHDVASSADGTLGFTVPTTLGPNCNPGQACPDFLLQVTPGEYDISISNADGTTDAGNFLVTGGTPAPSVDGGAADGSD